LLLLTLLTAALAAEAASAAAPVTLAPMFRDHAVLQRDVPLPIWGTAEPGAEIRAFFFSGDGSDAPSYSAVADADGRWRIVFPAQPAGGPCELCVGYAPAGEAGADIALGDASGPQGAGAVAEDILIGDVWLCSGQSNMDMNYGWGLTRGKEDIETNVHARIRLFDDCNRTALSPQRDLPDDYGWTPCDPAHAKSFSAVGYFFGQALQEAMPDVPIGLIEASWSGSPIKTWIPYEAAEALGGDFGKQAADRRAIAEAWKNGGAEQFKGDLAAWMEKLPAIDPGDAPAAPDFDDSDWQTANLPEITEKHTSADFDGWVWYRRTFVIDKKEWPIVEAASLSLGPVDDQDWTYVNGVLVGTTNLWDAPRNYEVPDKLLHYGTNTIAVKVLDWGGHSGFWKSGPMFLSVSWEYCDETDDGESICFEEGSIPLGGEWKFKAFQAEPRPVDPSSPSSWDIAACHNGMVAPLFGMAAKGAIWYQGCSDVGNADLYAKQFPAMVGAWREGFVHDDAGFPVYLVQLAAFKETHAEPLDSAWARMRWTQMQLGETVPHCGTAVAIDVGDHRDIHPKDKKTVGERLAALALAQTYGREGQSLSPVPAQAIYDWAAGRVTIQFVDPVSRKPAKLREDFDLHGFQVSVDGGDWKWAEKSFVNEKMFPDTVFVEGQDGVHTNVCVRYAWDDYPDGSLVSAEGLPVGPFELKAKILDRE
ncbi:MAG: hypothetical protein IJL06_11170, partial [Kiritimatiellae bacterium]|nr:hypothetical protein [Kiritimatiellia bacterium]